MWLSRKNTINNTTQTSPNRRSSFSRHSFKNIEDLLDDDDDPKNVSPTNKYPVHNTNDQQDNKQKQKQKQKQKHVVSSPKSLTHVTATRQSVFHRVCLANHVTRSLTPVRPKPIHEKSQPILNRNEKFSPRRNEQSQPNSPRRNEKFSPRGNEKSQPNSPRRNEKFSPRRNEKSQPNSPRRNEKFSPRRNEKSQPNSPRRNEKFSPKRNENFQPELNRNEKSSPRHKSDTSTPTIKIPNAENRIIVYVTSLRVVRSTFEACRTVRSILQGFLVQVDERDLSIDSSFKEELIKIMSQGLKDQQKTNFVDLPKVFIGGRYVGDAEDLRQLNETGELKKLVERLPPVSRSVCEECGDYRFIICTDCYGSRKCYKEKGGFRSCTVCNKNGLIRCSTCWTVI